MAETDSVIFFAVVKRKTLELVYCGVSDSLAARKWVNGTDHGQGPTEEAAIQNAWENVIRIRRGLEAAARRLDRERR